MKNALIIVCLIAISAPVHAAGKRSELDGVWILLRAEIGKVQLTPEGEKKLEQSRPLWEKAQAPFVRKFGKGRWDEFIGTLEEIRAHFG